MRPADPRVHDALSQVTWQEFEYLMAEYYRAEGWDVRHVGTAGEAKRFDGGVDLELRRDDEWVLVQCKHWRKQLVPHNALHELIGVVTTRGASRGIVVTSGQFTPAARAAASQQSLVRLVDGEEVRRMLAPWLEDRIPPAQRPPVMPQWPALVLVLACALLLLRCGVNALGGDASTSRVQARPPQVHPAPRPRTRPATADVQVLPVVKVPPASAATEITPSQSPPAASTPKDPDKAIRVIEATTPEM